MTDASFIEILWFVAKVVLAIGVMAIVLFIYIMIAEEHPVVMIGLPVAVLFLGVIPYYLWTHTEVWGKVVAGFMVLIGSISFLSFLWDILSESFSGNKSSETQNPKMQEIKRRVAAEQREDDIKSISIFFGFVASILFLADLKSGAYSTLAILAVISLVYIHLTYDIASTKKSMAERILTATSAILLVSFISQGEELVFFVSLILLSFWVFRDPSKTTKKTISVEGESEEDSFLRKFNAGVLTIGNIENFKIQEFSKSPNWENTLHCLEKEVSKDSFEYFLEHYDALRYYDEVAVLYLWQQSEPILEEIMDTLQECVKINFNEDVLIKTITVEETK